MLNIRKAINEDASSMAEILREIGWSEKRNSLPLEMVSDPIKTLIGHATGDPEGHTIYVAVNKVDKVIGFTNVHWVPFVMLGGIEGYVSDVFGKSLGKRYGCGKTAYRGCDE